MRLLYLYSTPRSELFRQSLSGQGPDSGLYGLNHLWKFGIDAAFVDDGFVRGRLSSLWQLIHSTMASHTGLGFNLEQAMRLRAMLGRFDVVFTTTESCGLPVALLRHCGLVQTPIVFGSVGLAERAEGRQDGLAFRLYRRALASVDRVVYYGYDEGRSLSRLLGLPERKLRFIRYGVDVDYFRPQRGGAAGFVLTAGKDACRDFDIFLAAVDGLDVPVKLVTSPGRLDGLRIPQNVEVQYSVPIGELRDYYARSMFVVVPVRDNSYSAGTTVLLEAMSMGKAVIASRTRAIKRGYGLQGGENCVLVTPGNVTELRDAIRRLLANPLDAARIGRNARRAVEDSHSSEAYAGRLAGVFKEVYEERI